MEEWYQNKSRRNFIKTGIGLAALSVAPSWAAAEPLNDWEEHLTILHTNDWHSRIDPFPENDAKYPGMGGAARRAALINQIRAEKNHLILLDAGDVFQGTPYFNFYGGEPEFKLMSTMGYDACTLGNHDFDNGIEGLVKMLPFAEFPFINCNYDVRNTALEEKIIPWKIIRRGRLKIGILGLGVELQGLVLEKNFKGIRYLNPVLCAENTVKFLKFEAECDFIICLSHLGYQYKDGKMSDLILASNTENIDLIIGGHTHTFMEKPVIVSNRIGRPVTIHQVGWAGLRLGRLDYVFSSINNVKNQGFSRNEFFKKSIAI
ncbi:MAG: metallophosphoesterase [Bacteroidia bacterium]|jgi:5'-nucleotidase|nr:metallophosphoesterase [Bacteroidia bacterium]MCC6767682.1 metallophosphoesterase [Bacteroidia bacterium]